MSPGVRSAFGPKPGVRSAFGPEEGAKSRPDTMLGPNADLTPEVG
jgi:hypothetical protein